MGNFKDILLLKSLSTVINGGELDVNKLMVLQTCLHSDCLDISDIIKTQLMAKLIKQKKSIDSLTDEQLILYGMLGRGRIDIQALINYKLMNGLMPDILSSDDDDDDDDDA